MNNNIIGYEELNLVVDGQAFILSSCYRQKHLEELGEELGICVGNGTYYSLNVFILSRPDGRGKVCLHVKNGLLYEAKGKGNSLPNKRDVVAAIMAACVEMGWKVCTTDLSAGFQLLLEYGEDPIYTKCFSLLSMEGDLSFMKEIGMDPSLDNWEILMKFSFSSPKFWGNLHWALDELKNPIDGENEYLTEREIKKFIVQCKEWRNNTW